ncbi:uncharacterized protein EV154DRAFT_156285 [Mucor mucedo]|uniref:uncharacterized protein n=1 Tax=Mucor mucedo TaxID=29922 RepID=UPI00221EBE8F|nr:uncharacterized protein EV154DRAFT_156285 [Mucor mucedo]KAI7893277.1 hypothetical protein EV154DRAFT_156285 [Mucor mucedo]
MLCIMILYLITGKIIFENSQGDIFDKNRNGAMWTGKKKLIPIIQNIWAILLNIIPVNNSKSPDRMDQPEKTIKASTISKNKYADHSESQKQCFILLAAKNFKCCSS